MTERRLSSWLRPLHLGMGLFFVAAFLGTGQYMDLRHDHLNGLDDATRMLFRSNHIYLLLIGVCNLGFGLYLTPAYGRWLPMLQAAGSVLLMATGLLFLVGFFTEPYLTDLARPWTSPGVYAVFSGGLLHLLAGLFDWLERRHALQE